jgi:hypothetical protein
LFSPITPVKLVAGQTYVVGGQGGAEYTGLIGDASADPRISFGIDLYSDVIGGANSPLVEPTNSEALGPNEDSWFGGNIELSTVPEPSTLGDDAARLRGPWLPRLAWVTKDRGERCVGDKNRGRPESRPVSLLRPVEEPEQGVD